MIASTKPHVLIAGAGLGGLTLAQCLRKRGIPFTIFERDASAHSRSQGWAIALHTVLADLVAGVSDDMPPIENVNHLIPLDHLPAQLKFYDAKPEAFSKGCFVVESKPAEEVGYGEGRAIRANRDRLRDWLCTNVDVQWGKQVAGFEQDDNGVTLKFSDGTAATGDILVSAEGARSKIRDGLLPDAELKIVPVCFLTGEVTLSKEEYERQLALAHSAYVVMGDGWHLFVGLNKIAEDASSADYYWDFIWMDEARMKPEPHWIDSASSEELYEYAVKATSDLDPKVSEIIRLTSPKSMKTPPLILRDIVLEDMPVTRVTLLGDAAHAMVPFRGEGGCNAIDDAIKLANALADGSGLGEYQKEMLARGSQAVVKSRAAGENQGEERRAWGQAVRMVPNQSS